MDTASVSHTHTHTHLQNVLLAGVQPQGELTSNIIDTRRDGYCQRFTHTCTYLQDVLLARVQLQRE
eukprot:4262483-Pyramimonas_sp.AAC.1